MQSYKLSLNPTQVFRKRFSLIKFFSYETLTASVQYLFLPFPCCRGFITLYHTPLLVDEELREVPLDARLLVVVNILLAEHPVKQGTQLVFEIEAAKGLSPSVSALQR